MRTTKSINTVILMEPAKKTYPLPVGEILSVHKFRVVWTGTPVGDAGWSRSLGGRNDRADVGVNVCPSICASLTFTTLRATLLRSLVRPTPPFGAETETGPSASGVRKASAASYSSDGDLLRDGSSRLGGGVEVDLCEFATTTSVSSPFWVCELSASVP